MSTPITDSVAHRGYNESAYIAEMTDTARDLERKLSAMTKERDKYKTALIRLRDYIIKAALGNEQ